jgi:hypothetical protein
MLREYIRLTLPNKASSPDERLPAWSQAPEHQAGDTSWLVARRSEFVSMAEFFGEDHCISI